MSKKQDCKIYTKSGDRGQTSLLGGSRVSKNHIKIEAYGTVDELKSFIGMVHAKEWPEITKTSLLRIQNQLFIIESLLAVDNEAIKANLSKIENNDILLLEQAIDAMNLELPEIRNFILPSGSETIALCHVARCVCRRAERIVVNLADAYPVEPVILEYLNRLSDYLFVLARYSGFLNNIPEIFWATKK